MVHNIHTIQKNKRKTTMKKIIIWIILIPMIIYVGHIILTHEAETITQICNNQLAEGLIKNITECNITLIGK